MAAISDDQFRIPDMNSTSMICSGSVLLCFGMAPLVLFQDPETGTLWNNIRSTHLTAPNRTPKKPDPKTQENAGPSTPPPLPTLPHAQALTSGRCASVAPPWRTTFLPSVPTTSLVCPGIYLSPLGRAQRWIECWAGELRHQERGVVPCMYSGTFPEVQKPLGHCLELHDLVL